ncbi:hypothetical protein, partial [Moorena sp. SIO4A1]|uniref:hypothetical protein n=1 Tax=Moorena sp. SIO4A1 TaxID=2607835 RepID=UPI0025CFC750
FFIGLAHKFKTNIFLLSIPENLNLVGFSRSCYSATRKSEVRSQKSKVSYDQFSEFRNVLILMRSAIPCEA